MEISRIFGQNIYFFYVKSSVCLLFYISFSAAHSPSRIDVDFVESLEIHLLKIIISFFASIKCPQWIFLVKKKVQKICTKFGKKEARKNGTQPTVYSRHSGPIQELYVYTKPPFCCNFIIIGKWEKISNNCSHFVVFSHYSLY